MAKVHAAARLDQHDAVADDAAAEGGEDVVVVELNLRKYWCENQDNEG